jgi:GNAT superfamily N-acetyltransferase
MPVIRPMLAADVPAVHDLTVATFDDLERRLNREPEPPPDPAEAHIRYHHLVRTDPGGAWVAESEDGIDGCALALLREGVWGLSLLVVRPGLQSGGVGSGLLRHANEYAAGARGRIILSSPDPRAIRAYARLGLAVEPCLFAKGAPHGVREPGGIRIGTKADIPLTAEIDRHTRGGPHGPDIGALLDMNQKLLIAHDRAYAVMSDGGGLRMLSGLDEDAAGDVLRAVLARAKHKASVSWMTAKQQWAIRVCLDARLDLHTSDGVLFLDGDVGSFHPYLPSGTFL